MTTTEITSPVWQIYDPPLIDNSTTEYEYIEYKEKRVNVEGLIDYEFINQDLDFYLLPSESYLQFKGRIRSTAGDVDNGIFNAGDVALVNGGCNLFDRARYDMEDQQIQQLDYAGIGTQVKGLIDYQKDYEHTLSNEMWAIDRADGQTKQRNLTVTVAGVAGAFSIQAANLLGITAGADNAIIVFSIDGVPIEFVDKTTEAAAINVVLNKRGGGANAPIDFATPGVGGDQIEAYANGRKLQFYLRGRPAFFYLIAATFDLAISNGAATAAGVSGELTAEYVDEYNSDTLSRNEGFIKRQDKILRKTGANPRRYDKIFNICIPLKRFFQIFEANQHVFRGVKHTVKLWKNPSLANLILRNGATNDVAGTGVGTAVGFVTISYAAWWVPALKPSLSVGLQIDKDLAAGMKKTMMWDEINTYKSNAFTANTTSATWRILATSHKPSKVYIVCQSTTRDNNQLVNNMLFDNLSTVGDANRPGVDRAQVRLGSVQYPREEYVVNFVQGTGEDVSRLYEMYLTMHGKLSDKTSGALISIDEFRDLYPIFCFDLSAQDPKIWQSVTPIDIEARFHIGGQGAPTEFVMWAVVQYERHITLTGANNRMKVIL